jgi:uncharacterized protein YjbI with pentapeptide repeats
VSLSPPNPAAPDADGDDDRTGLLGSHPWTAGSLCAAVLVVLAYLVFHSKSIAPLTAVLIAIGLGGAALWIPRRHSRSARADVGSALVTTAAISAVFFGLQTQDEQKQSSIADVQHAQEQNLANLEAQEVALGTDSNLRFVDLSNKPLGRFDLGNKDLYGADLYGLHLSYGSLIHSNLDAATLNRAFLAHTQFNKAKLRDATIEGAHLFKANFDQADVTNANFGVAYQKGHRAQAGALMSADFEDAEARGACFAGAHLAHANFEGADLRGANFDSAHLPRVTFISDGVGAAVQGATFHGATLRPYDRTYLEQHGAVFGPLAPLVPPKPPANASSDRVVKESDGDTVKLQSLGWVRLLGVNAPDDATPATKVANSYTARTLPVGAEVLYVPGHPKREPRPDHLGRALIYLWTTNGTFVNEDLLAKGLALRESDQGQGQHPPYDKVFRKAENYAREDGQGVWSFCPEFKGNDLIIAGRTHPKHHGGKSSGGSVKST